jgi:hypothetical protein
MIHTKPFVKQVLAIRAHLHALVIDTTKQILHAI